MTDELNELLEAARSDAGQMNIDNDTVIETLGLDSMDYIALISGVEEKFRVSITNKDASTFRTVGDIAHWLEAHKC